MTTARQSRFVIRGAVVAIAIAILAMAGCKRDPSTAPAPAPAPSTPPAPAPVVAADAPPPSEPQPPLYDASIYDLELKLLDDRGATIGLDVFRGQPTLIAMFYGSCQSACPRLIEDMKAFDAKLPAEQRDKLRVLLVSFDAARDTPHELSELRQAHGLDATRWRLAALPEEDARTLGAALNVRFRLLASGEFFHTSAVTLLGANGRPLARVEGLGRDLTPLKEALP